MKISKITAVCGICKNSIKVADHICRACRLLKHILTGTPHISFLDRYKVSKHTTLPDKLIYAVKFTSIVLL